jgi:hypothetical protein
MVSTLRTKAADAIDGDEHIKSAESKTAIKEGLNDFIDALKGTLEEGAMDGGAVLNMEPKSLTFVAGGQIADPSKIETGLKKIVEAAAKEDPNTPKVNWSSSTHGDVTYHTFSHPLPPDDKELRQMVGDNVDMAIGVGKKSVYFAFGRDCVAAVNNVIDKSAASPAKAIAPVEMTLALGQMINVAKEFAEPGQKPQIQMIADMLANEANGRDHLRLVTQPIENGLRTRLEAEEGVLRAPWPPRCKPPAVRPRPTNWRLAQFRDNLTSVGRRQTAGAFFVRRRSPSDLRPLASLPFPPCPPSSSPSSAPIAPVLSSKSRRWSPNTAATGSKAAWPISRASSPASSASKRRRRRSTP